MKRPSAKLLRKWYGKLTDTGFIDIERGKDMNMYPATTMPAGHVQIDPLPISTDDDGHGLSLDVETRSLANSEQAQHWRRITKLVNKLKPHEHKQFLLDWAESGNLSETCADYGVSLRRGQYITKQFMAFAGLYTGRGRISSRDKETPGPVRVLDKSEFALLGYRTPRQIKDSSEP